MTMPEIQQDTDLFADFPSIGAILAFVFKAAGPAGVKEILSQTTLNVDELGEIAGELASIGLPAVSSLVQAAMKSAPEAPPPWSQRRGWLRSYRETHAVKAPYCDLCETDHWAKDGHQWKSLPAKNVAAEISESASPRVAASTSTALAVEKATVSAKFDRARYQREYMRKWRLRQSKAKI